MCVCVCVILSAHSLSFLEQVRLHGQDSQALALASDI